MSVWPVIKQTGKALWRAIGGRPSWPEVYVSPGVRPEPVMRRYSYLRQRGIRCRIYNLSSTNPRMGYHGMVSLRVHPEDRGRAYQLMSEVRD